MSAGIAPLYFSEISPQQWRGAVGTTYQLVVVIAILLSQILGLEAVLGNEPNWSLLFGECTIHADIIHHPSNVQNVQCEDERHLQVSA